MLSGPHARQPRLGFLEVAAGDAQKIRQDRLFHRQIVFAVELLDELIDDPDEMLQPAAVQLLGDHLFQGGQNIRVIQQELTEHLFKEADDLKERPCPFPVQVDLALTRLSLLRLRRRGQPLLGNDSILLEFHALLIQDRHGSQDDALPPLSLPHLPGLAEGVAGKADVRVCRVRQ